MRIISWNCQGALRKKLKPLASLKADIFIVQECENPLYSTAEYREWAGNYLWVGDSRHKGLGLFAKSRPALKALAWNGSFTLPLRAGNTSSFSWKTADLKLFLPCRFGKYTILAVWTKDNPKGGAFAYIGQLWKYLQLHGADLRGDNSLIIGDFNSNIIWDKADRWWNHSDVVRELQAFGFVSLYHRQTGEEQGAETCPSFYLYRQQDKGYHIDYAFCAGNLARQSRLSLGKPTIWLEFSDHMPLIVDIAA